MSKIIDISTFQGVVDFNKVKSQVDGVIVRAGYGKGNIDKQFVRNITECNRLGIPCGAYWFSYAYTPAMAQAEANYFLSAVKPYRMELPLAFDYEYDSVTFGQKQGASINATLVRSMTQMFCDTIEKAGYYCMLYANPDFINRYFGNLANRYDLWLAQWPIKVDVTKPPRTCGIWQWGSSKVAGINGDVDTNEAYKDYVNIIKNNGLNNLKPVEPEPTPSKPTTTKPWYTECMTWAKNNGINDGTRPTETATRAEVTQMLYNYYNRFNTQ